MSKQREYFPGTDEGILRKVIITAAISGAVHTPTMSDYLPLTPEQIIDDAVRSHEAGAAMIHIHARKPENGEPTPDLKIFREILSGIKKRCNAVIIVTTGGAGTIEERIAVVPEFKPEMATLNCGSLSGTAIDIWERLKGKFKYEWEDQRLQRMDRIFTNTFQMMHDYSKADRENNTKPELEIWDIGQIGAVKFMLDHGWVDRPIQIQFVMGSMTGMPATASTLLLALEEAKRQLGEFTWAVCVAGRDQFPIAAISLAIGGNVRVGLEDNLYCGYGRMTTSSAEQVERVVRMARELSIAPATSDDARQILGLKGLDKVNF